MCIRYGQPLISKDYYYTIQYINVQGILVVTFEFTGAARGFIIMSCAARGGKKVGQHWTRLFTFQKLAMDELILLSVVNRCFLLETEIVDVQLCGSNTISKTLCLQCGCCFNPFSLPSCYFSRGKMHHLIFICLNLCIAFSYFTVYTNHQNKRIAVSLLRSSVKMREMSYDMIYDLFHHTVHCLTLYYINLFYSICFTL